MPLSDEDVASINRELADNKREKTLSELRKELTGRQFEMVEEIINDLVRQRDI